MSAIPEPALPTGMPAARDVATPAREHLPGDASVWVFVLGEMIIFAAYFAAYMVDRGRNHELLRQSSQQLNLGMGVINTLTLLTSSLFVAMSVQATRTGDIPAASRWLALGGACGVGFVVIKSIEWHAKLAAGVFISTNAFFMHYYVMTGVHLFHVLLGLVILVILWRELHGARTPRAQLMEIGASYWHTVDLLWIVIFALLYLVR